MSRAEALKPVSVKRGRLLLFLTAVALFVIALFLPSVVSAQHSITPKRVLVLYWYNKDFPGNVLFDQTFQAGLRNSPANIEYYPEYLESNRFPGDSQELILRDYLRQKYAALKLDEIVAISDASLYFVLKYRTDLFPDTPIVFVAAKKPDDNELKFGPGMTGITAASTHRETVDLALQLHPGTENLFVISGTLEGDKRFEKLAREAFHGYENKVNITYLTDYSLPDLIAKTSNLPSRSVVLYVWQQELADDGRLIETYDVLSTFAPTCSAPIYGMGSVNVGRGIVGGYVSSSEANGTKIAELVLRVLNGTRPQDIPVRTAPVERMFDWRQLQRWQISESSLPAGSVLRFRQYSFWERNKWKIIVVVSLFALQSLFIGVLLVERRRRRFAKEALAQLNAELEQRIAARTAALDAKTRELETFAYSVAHDLKAPLRGIDGYSRLLIEDHFDKLNAEGRTFLETIRSSTSEMDQLIEDLLDYSRLERRPLSSDKIELQPLVKALVEHKEREFSERNIDFIVNVNGGSIKADSNGVTQALNNYLDNAIKFTSDMPQSRIEVGSNDTGDSCIIWVRDNGIGFDMKYHDRIFDIFQRLNHSEQYPGTGIGLAIVRKAMERMGGRAWAESEPGQGATFFIEIPRTP